MKTLYEYRVKALAGFGYLPVYLEGYALAENEQEVLEILRKNYDSFVDIQFIDAEYIEPLREIAPLQVWETKELPR